MPLWTLFLGMTRIPEGTIRYHKGSHSSHLSLAEKFFSALATLVSYMGRLTLTVRNLASTFVVPMPLINVHMALLHILEN